MIGSVRLALRATSLNIDQWIKNPDSECQCKMFCFYINLMKCVSVCVCVSVSISNSSSDLGEKVPGNLEWSHVGPNEGKEPKKMTQAPNLMVTICTDEI